MDSPYFPVDFKNLDFSSNGFSMFLSEFPSQVLFLSMRVLFLGMSVGGTRSIIRLPRNLLVICLKARVLECDEPLYYSHELLIVFLNYR